MLISRRAGRAWSVHGLYPQAFPLLPSISRRLMVLGHTIASKAATLRMAVAKPPGVHATSVGENPGRFCHPVLICILYHRIQPFFPFDWIRLPESLILQESGSDVENDAGNCVRFL